MIRGFHVIVSCDGFWLPNDPRGSWSDFVREWDLLRFGPATKVATRRSVADRPHDRATRLAAKQALQYPLVRLTDQQIDHAADGIAEAATDGAYAVHALAILSDHWHMVLGRHAKHIDQIVAHLKALATKHLRRAGLHPLARYPKKDGSLPSPWSRNHWKVFIDSDEQMAAAIR